MHYGAAIDIQPLRLISWEVHRFQSVKSRIVVDKTNDSSTLKRRTKLIKDAQFTCWSSQTLAILAYIQITVQCKIFNNFLHQVYS